MDDRQLHDLLVRCHRSEADAQHQLYNYCYPYGLTVALYYSGCREEAEEILQDGFLKLFTQLTSSPEPPRELRSYFRRILINTAIDHHRRQRIVRMLPGLLTTTPNAAVDLLNTEDLYRLVQRLPPAYRMVFNLYVLEGHTHREIAVRLGISVGASKSNLHKARQHLQRLAGPYFNLDNKLSNA